MKRAIVIIILIAIMMVTAPRSANTTVANTTKIANTTTTTVAAGATIADFDKPATEYAGPLDKADRIIIAALVDTMGGNEASKRAIVDIVYNRHVAPIEWFGDSVQGIVAKPDQFPYNPNHQPTKAALDLVDDELRRILDGTPSIPEGFCFFYIEDDKIVPFRYESGGLGSPGDKIVTYSLN